MAKKPQKSASLAPAAMALLQSIAAATASGNHVFVSKDEATPLLEHKPQLIVVNLELREGDKAAAKATEDGLKMVAPKAGSVQPTQATSAFTIMKGVKLPASRRGMGLGGGRTNKYPFDTMEIGDSFFVPVSEDMPEPLKTLGSTVSSANMRYAEEVPGETREVTRTKRGADRKAVVENGQKVKETVKLPKYKFTRKFEIRGVKAGTAYGSWTPQQDGALIARTA